MWYFPPWNIIYIYIYGSGTVSVNKWVMNFYFHANNLLTPKIGSETDLSLFLSKNKYFGSFLTLTVPDIFWKLDIWKKKVQVFKILKLL